MILAITIVLLLPTPPVGHCCNHAAAVNQLLPCPRIDTTAMAWLLIQQRLSSCDTMQAWRGCLVWPRAAPYAGSRVRARKCA
jgi:hypothetical protein